MALFRQSVRARLLFFITALLVIHLGLAVVVTISLINVHQQTEAINQKWLVGSQMLGELSHQFEEFRIAEAYRASAIDPASRAETELLGSQHRSAIDNLQNQYVTLVDGSPVADLTAFRTALKAYLAEHDAWVTADSDGTRNTPARYRSALHDRYKAADVAIDRLVESNNVAAQTEATAVNKLVGDTLIIVIAVSGVAVLLGGTLVARVHKDITRPLGAITASLSKLAAGNRDVQVPELNRKDEIGEMAKAFDIFRANAQALEQAHAATQAAQEHAQMLARHDPLTGLPNRRVLSAELQTAVSHAQNGSAVYLVLVIDLDRFKPVNDLQGHPVGDVVLCEVARRLREAVRKHDTVARVGGDEFAIIAQAEQPAYADGAMLLATRLLSAIREPIVVGESKIEVGASIGIASCPTDGLDPENLLRAADIAMYRAKREQRGTFRFFERSMDEELRAQAALEADLRTAIAEGAIHPHYQPLVDMHDNRVYGFEILARWHHAKRGSVPADVFIPLAEQLGLISDLTASMLREACRDARRWADDDIHLSLNISPIQLRDSRLPTQLLPILSEEGFSSSRLEIEVTETALVGDMKSAKAILAAFQSVGIKISLDDFGTGYSSLYHLRELKFDKVKIDKSFVQSMRHNNESEKIVDAILSLTKSLGMPAVAEGIEDLASLKSLSDKGCEYGQGFYFGKAMSADKVQELLSAV